jgi:hypothetical protein
LAQGIVETEARTPEELVSAIGNALTKVPANDAINWLN